jgi:hypothetical protein
MDFSISKLLKKSNFYKETGIWCIVVLKEIFRLVFYRKNLFHALKMGPASISFKKNSAYRFLSSSNFNWARLLLLLGFGIGMTESGPFWEEFLRYLVTDTQDANSNAISLWA